MSFKKLKIKSSAFYIINKAGQNRARVTRMLIIHWLVAPLSTLIPPRMHTYTLLICYDLYLSLCLTSLWVCASVFTVNGDGLRSSDVWLQWRLVQFQFSVFGRKQGFTYKKKKKLRKCGRGGHFNWAESTNLKVSQISASMQTLFCIIFTHWTSPSS